MKRTIISALLVLLVIRHPVWANEDVRNACEDVDSTISELIKFAPNGTGWVNRIRAWFENLFGMFSDLFLDGGELSEVGHAVIGIDFYQNNLYAELIRILKVEGEVVEEIMPDKFDSPAIYITKLKVSKDWLIEPRCKRYQRG